MEAIMADLFEYIKSLEIIDTHEHLPHQETERDKKTDILKEYFTYYSNRDLISAGLPVTIYKKIIDTSLPVEERWKLIKPYWDLTKNTGYGRVINYTIRGLYGVDELNKFTIGDLNSIFKKSLQPGHFEKVLKDKSKIKISVLDSNLDCDQNLFRSTIRLGRFVYPKTNNIIKIIEEDCEIRITNFMDWLEACNITLEKSLAKGGVVLKIGQAYERTLRFDRFSRKEAEEEFENVLKRIELPAGKENTFQVGKKFQDYMMHYILRLINQKKLTVQIHTGLLDGNGNIIYNSDPTLLSNLFLEYKDIDFDIFHIGYPYQQKLSSLAKNFPNVYIDMCWAHMISPQASINALIEWLDSVPYNKICAFGGDYCVIDLVYGHQLLAREYVSIALAKKVEEGIFDIDQAKLVGKMLFYDNPYKILKLKGKI